MVYVQYLAPEHDGAVGKNTLKQSAACSSVFGILGRAKREGNLLDSLQIMTSRPGP